MHAYKFFYKESSILRLHVCSTHSNNCLWMHEINRGHKIGTKHSPVVCRPPPVSGTAESGPPSLLSPPWLQSIEHSDLSIVAASNSL